MVRSGYPNPDPTDFRTGLTFVDFHHPKAMVSPGSGLFCMGNFKSWNGRWLPQVGDGPSWKLRHLLNFFRFFPAMPAFFPARPAFFLGRLSQDKSSLLTLLVCINCCAWRFSERVSNSACVTVSCHENGYSFDFRGGLLGFRVLYSEVDA